MEETIRVATRESKLALRQYAVVEELLTGNGIKVSMFGVTSAGDLDRHSPLYESGGTGLFVRNLNRMVLDGAVDVAVHSAKDIPGEICDGLTISYFSERADARDYFVSPARLDDYSGTVGSSSIRRRNFLTFEKESLRFVNIRGNIETRLRKWKDGEVGALVIAKAALDRLGISVPGHPIPEAVSPPAPNQGFIAVVTRQGSREDSLFRKLQDDAPLWEARAERDLMRRLGAGCSIPIAIRAHFSSRTVRVSYADDGRRYDFSFKVPITDSDVRLIRGVIDA